MTPANPILVETTRSGKVEQVHRGALVIMGRDRTSLLTLGNGDQLVYPRSALKYFQVLPLLMSGAVEAFGLDEEEIAVMCASHNGEPRHLEVVQRILRKAEISEAQLQCGAHNPLSVNSWEEMIRQGIRPTQLHNNCSGKHAGFLALSKYLGHSPENYLDLDHPVQKMVRAVVAKMCGLPEDQLHPGLDGCSAPNYALPLKNLALGFRNLAEPEGSNSLQEACARVVKAVSAFPEMVGGENRYCTEMMQICAPNIIGKLGASGVYAMTFTDQKLGVAIKMDDGATGPQYTVAQELIRATGRFSAEACQPLQKYLTTPVLNCVGLEVGVTRIPEGGLLASLEE
ncbi:MAG: asparaginase [Bacteroidia bacterium]|nr:asparaginase [Bacteroidia bacterium]